MARSMITGRETQKMQEYTQERINQAERRGVEFPIHVKEQIFEYANLIGEEEKVRTLVRNLADALSRADEEGVEDLLDDAKWVLITYSYFPFSTSSANCCPKRWAVTASTSPGLNDWIR